MNKLLIALAVGVTAIGSAQAQTTTIGNDWASRTYLGVAVSGAEIQTADNDWKAGGKVFAGYNFDQNWAVEGAYTRFGNETFNLSGSSPAFGQGEVKSASSYIAAKYAVPLNDRLSAYGKLGLAYNERKVTLPNDFSYSRDDKGVYGAVGLQYALGQNLSLVGEYERYGKTPDLGAKADVVSVGLKVGF